jgi:hypothetical protein
MQKLNWPSANTLQWKLKTIDVFHINPQWFSLIEIWGH